MSGLCPWIIFFWFPLESWFSWILIYYSVVHLLRSAYLFLFSIHLVYTTDTIDWSWILRCITYVAICHFPYISPWFEVSWIHWIKKKFLDYGLSQNFWKRRGNRRREKSELYKNHWTSYKERFIENKSNKTRIFAAFFVSFSFRVVHLYTSTL